MHAVSRIFGEGSNCLLSFKVSLGVTHISQRWYCESDCLHRLWARGSRRRYSEPCRYWESCQSSDSPCDCYRDGGRLCCLWVLIPWNFTSSGIEWNPRNILPKRVNHSISVDDVVGISAWEGILSESCDSFCFTWVSQDVVYIWFAWWSQCDRFIRVCTRRRWDFQVEGARHATTW
jgi:hypothetical protein